MLPDARWLVDLLVSAALGSGAYVVALLAVGLRPNERATALRLAGRFLGRRSRRVTASPERGGFPVVGGPPDDPRPGRMEPDDDARGGERDALLRMA